MTVTGEQVRAAMEAANVHVVPHHDCSICGQWTSYQRIEGRLYYSSGCGCSWSPPRLSEWSDAAEWINMQSDPKWRAKIAASFGLELDTPAKIGQ